MPVVILAYRNGHHGTYNCYYDTYADTSRNELYRRNMTFAELVELSRRPGFEVRFVGDRYAA